MRRKDFKVVPLEQVNGLPIGVPNDEGKLTRRVELNQWDWETEEAVMKLMGDNPQMTISELTTNIMCRMIRVWGEFNFEELEFPAREIRLRNSFMADVIFAYILLRVESMGKDWLQKFVCPTCRCEIPWVGDLNTLDIYCCELDKACELETRIDLPHNILLGVTEVSWVVLRPTTWEIMHTLPAGANDRDPRVRRMIFENSICGAQDIETHGAIMMNDDRLKTLKKRDIELLGKLLDDNQGGADFRVEMNCPKCRSKFRTFGDWSYDSFFGPSSLPEA